MHYIQLFGSAMHYAESQVKSAEISNAEMCVYYDHHALLVTTDHSAHARALFSVPAFWW